MRVRIRLQQGPRIQQKRRKNRHIALASAALLTPGALAAFVLSMWRLGADLGFARSFAIGDGIFSHWQVWLAISAPPDVRVLKEEDAEASEDGEMP